MRPNRNPLRLFCKQRIFILDAHEALCYAAWIGTRTRRYATRGGLDAHEALCYASFKEEVGR